MRRRRSPPSTSSRARPVAFSGRLEPRTWTTRDGGQRVALELRGVELDYGAKPRGSGDEEPVGEVAF